MTPVWCSLCKRRVRITHLTWHVLQEHPMAMQRDGHGYFTCICGAKRDLSTMEAHLRLRDLSHHIAEARLKPRLDP